MSDRRVHATMGDAEIVRYDRAGKWYYESSDHCRQLTIAEAVQFVPTIDHARLGVPGGKQFDKRVRDKFEVR